MPLPPVHRLILAPMRQEKTDRVVYVAYAGCGRELGAGALVTSAAAWVTCLQCRELREGRDMTVGIKLEAPRTLLLEGF